MIVYNSQEKTCFREKLTETEVKFHFTMADFAKNSTKSQWVPLTAALGSLDEYINDLQRERTECRDQLSRVLKTFCDATVGNKIMQKITQTKDWQTRIPTDSAAMRRNYIDGRYSITKQMPYPEPSKLDNFHSYVSLVDCIQHMFMHGASYFDHNAADIHSPNNGHHCISHCLMAKQIRKTQTTRLAKKTTRYVDLDLIEWSDDFEPRNSVKRGRGSIWVKVVSVVAPVGSKNLERNTFLIAVGEKGADHSVVEQKFAEELQTLRTSGVQCCDPISKETKLVKAMLLVSIQDQPERRSACGITAGSGRYTRRWGYAFPVDEHKDKLPSCDQCFMEELMDKINGAFDEAGAANEERDNDEKNVHPVLQLVLW